MHPFFHPPEVLVIRDSEKNLTDTCAKGKISEIKSRTCQYGFFIDYFKNVFPNPFLMFQNVKQMWGITSFSVAV